MTDASTTPPELARTYLQKGEEDEAVLRLLATEAQMPDSALGMHAHQAVERYLLAALIAQGFEPNKTRDLGELMAQLTSVPAHVRAAEFLTAYEVLERDPLQDVAALDRSQALDVVNRIRGWAEEIVSSAG
ncbi:MAG TPA: HEPN domain-containing protein [Actinomycetota bacterium]|nr:HEPN domain-containing protein [Actinomycetota bacterium]